MNQEWKETFQSDALKQACIHEAGHIVVAKAMNCQVLSTEVFEDGNGMSTIHYGKFNQMVKALANHEDKEVAEYSRNDEFGAVVNTYVIILLAGHLAEFLYKEDFQSSGMAKVLFEGKDSSDIKYISKLYGADAISSSSKGTSAILHDNKEIVEMTAMRIYESRSLNCDEIQVLTQNVVNPLR